MTATEQSGSGTHGGHAIVVGAGTTGLAAAAAAARHFNRVTVIDRDELPSGPQWRKGVPQSCHLHVLLRRGEEIFNELLPGLSDALIAQGAQRLDMGRDTNYFHSSGWKLRFDSGVTMMSQSKGLLEWTIRQHVLGIDAVTIRDRTSLTGLCSDGTRITGVKLGDGTELAADLVIDASGRGSRTPARLAGLGFGTVPTSELAIELSYSTRIYRRPADADDWQLLIVHPMHPDTRLGAIQAVEGDRWVVTLAGWNGAQVPADEKGFVEFARTLVSPALYEAIANAEPIDEIRRWRFPANRRRHYEKLDAMPDGLVVIGDAVNSFSPIYGQGMTQGATGARILDECLALQPRESGSVSVDGLSRRFHARYAEFAARCWSMATTDDFAAMPGAPGRPWWSSLASWYLLQVQRLTFSDPLVALRFLEVMHMLKPLSWLMTPAVVVRVLFRVLRGGWRDTAADERAASRPVALASRGR